jgi:hypothetical protein
MEENVWEYDSLANIPWIIIYVTGKLSIFPSFRKSYVLLQEFVNGPS